MVKWRSGFYNWVDSRSSGIKYLLYTIIGIYIAYRIIVALAHEVGLLKLIVLQRYLNGEITDEELKQFKEQ